MARWDGQAWQPFYASTGFDGFVRALVVHEGDLFAGGEFEHADGALVHHVARWNGTAWWAPHPDPGGIVTRISIVGEDYYAYSFTRALRWTGGSEWEVIGDGGLDSFREVHLHQNSVWYGGHFEEVAHWFPAHHIARWDLDPPTPIDAGQAPSPPGPEGVLRVPEDRPPGHT